MLGKQFRQICAMTFFFSALINVLSPLPDQRTGNLWGLGSGILFLESSWQDAGAQGGLTSSDLTQAPWKPNPGGHLFTDHFLSCLPALSKCSPFCSALPSPNIWILLSLLSYLRTFLTTQPVAIFPPTSLVAKGPALAPCAVRGLYRLSLDQSISSLRAGGCCLISL